MQDSTALSTPALLTGEETGVPQFEFALDPRQVFVSDSRPLTEFPRCVRKNLLLFRQKPLIVLCADIEAAADAVQFVCRFLYFGNFARPTAHGCAVRKLWYNGLVKQVHPRYGVNSNKGGVAPVLAGS